MKKIIPKSDEFYVGYFKESPRKTSTFLKKLIVLMGLVVLSACVLLVMNQRSFSTASFEYGVNTTVTGYVYKSPVPRLVVILGQDIRGNQLTQTILLVDFGKSGAKELLTIAERNLSLPTIDGKLVNITGYLIYGDGKALMQINDARDIALERNGVVGLENDPGTFKKGNRALTGEIIDPKCFFGVMKPGSGKPHRSCAIRCISGGIPPVFSSDSSGYFLMVSESFEPLNQTVLGIVGDHIAISGEVIRMNDWNVIQVKQGEILSLAKSKVAVKTLAFMEKGMTICIPPQIHE